jgi:hypothetical protein
LRRVVSAGNASRPADDRGFGERDVRSHRRECGVPANRCHGARSMRSPAARPHDVPARPDANSRTWKTASTTCARANIFVLTLPKFPVGSNLQLRFIFLRRAQPVERVSIAG